MSECAWGGAVEDPPSTPGTTGFDLAAHWGSPPADPHARAGWIVRVFLPGLSLEESTASEHVVPAWVQFFLFGGGLSGAIFSAGRCFETSAHCPGSVARFW
jgi:hypothetical protein